MTTMGKQVTRAGHDTPNTSTIASKKAPRGRRCGVSLRINEHVLRVHGKPRGRGRRRGGCVRGDSLAYATPPTPWGPFRGRLGCIRTLLGRLGDCFGGVSLTFHANVSGLCLGAGFRASWRVWRASRSNCGAAGRGAAGVGVGGNDCGAGVAWCCCSVDVAVVGGVAAGAEADLCIPAPFLIALGSDKGTKATNGE